MGGKAPFSASPAALPAQWSCASHQRRIVRMRCRTRRAVSGRTVHIGSSTASTSLRRIRSTFTSPMTGKAWSSNDPHQFTVCLSFRQRGRFASYTFFAASRKVGNVGPVAFGQRIATGGDQRLVGERERASLCQADRRIAAKPHISAAPVDHDSLHPRPRSRACHPQIEPVPVTVHAGFLDRLDLCGGKSRHSQPHISPTLMWGNVGYLARTRKTVT